MTRLALAALLALVACGGEDPASTEPAPAEQTRTTFAEREIPCCRDGAISSFAATDWTHEPADAASCANCHPSHRASICTLPARACPDDYADAAQMLVPTATKFDPAHVTPR